MIFELKNIFFYFMCMSILTVRMFVHHLCAVLAEVRRGV